MCALINPATKTLFPARIIFMVDHGPGSGRIGSKVPPDGRDHCREPCSAQMPLVSALTFLGQPQVLPLRPARPTSVFRFAPCRHSASLHAGYRRSIGCAHPVRARYAPRMSMAHTLAEATATALPEPGFE